MGRRISIMLDNSVWLELQQVPQREHSGLISEAVRKELQCRGRSRAAAGMDRLRKTGRTAIADSDELVRADRDAHW
jgi:hypothetical protein